MTENKDIENLTVDFYEVDAGWLRFTLTTGRQEFGGRFSYVYAPILDLKSWLEAIAVGVQQTSFDYDSEGYETKFDFKRVAWNKEVFTVSDIDESDKIFINATVDRRQLVKAFYLGLLNFASSDKFKSDEWEIELMSERLCKLLKLDDKILIDELADLDGKELGQVLFNANPRYIISFPTAKDPSEKIKLFIETSVKNKELPEEHTMVETPDKWEIPNDYNFWTTDNKCELVIECLKDIVSPYSGAKINDFRSSIIEKYLDEE